MSASAGLSEECLTNLDADGFGPTVELDKALESENLVNNVARTIKSHLPPLTRLFSSVPKFAFYGRITGPAQFAERLEDPVSAPSGISGLAKMSMSVIPKSE